MLGKGVEGKKRGGEREVIESQSCGQRKEGRKEGPNVCLLMEGSAVWGECNAYTLAKRRGEGGRGERGAIDGLICLQSKTAQSLPKDPGLLSSISLLLSHR